MSTGHDGGDRYAALRTRAIESLLIEKGLLSEQAVDVVVEAYGSDIGPLHGARVVARAWTDPAFRERLLEDATAAARELGVGGFVSEYVRAVENTEDQHNLVVCTLCSCYPWGLLGLPPAWYKSPEYRARAVREPRAVLREFGVELDEETEIRIWDSSSDLRYIVIPRRPEGTGDLAEDELAALVTRESMIGTGLARSPSHEQRRRPRSRRDGRPAAPQRRARLHGSRGRRAPSASPWRCASGRASAGRRSGAG